MFMFSLTASKTENLLIGFSYIGGIMIAEGEGEKRKERKGGKKGFVVEVPLSIEDYVRLEAVVIRKFGRKRGVFTAFVRDCIMQKVAEEEKKM